jgi:glutamate synthase (NADPH/NADH) large chain
VIIGNTVLYGATAGKLFASGQAGERFAVRNSGAVTVVEGCGSNGVEYMTGGVAVILGPVGDNFAAGMTGGMAFVHDPKNEFMIKVNPDSVVWERIGSSYWNDLLVTLIEEHVAETGSRHAKRLLDQWEIEKQNFWQVCPKEMLNRLKHPLSDRPAAAIA